MQTSARRQSRELALQVLFQNEFLGPVDFETSLSLFKGKYEAPKEVWDYARFLLAGVLQHRENIDGLIEKQSANWSLKRMALVDLLLMRIAVFEIRFSSDPVPAAAAINEALEICRKYSNTDSAQFINGILDPIASQK